MGIKKQSLILGFFSAVFIFLFLFSANLTYAQSSDGTNSGFPMTDSTLAQSSSGGGWSLGNISSFGLPGGSVRDIIENILVWMLGIFGIIGIIGFVISGIIYLTSAGDDDRMALAKKAMYYSIIGVIVGLIGFVIIQAVNMALNAMGSF